MAQGTIKRNRRLMQARRTRFINDVKKELEESAIYAREACASQLSGGFMHKGMENAPGDQDDLSSQKSGQVSTLNSDTGALKNSFYIVSVLGGGNRYYETARNRSEAAYMSGSEGGVVPQNHYLNLLFPRIKGGRVGSTYIAGAASCLKYAAYWNNGHNNWITHQFERYPFIDAARYQAEMEFRERMIDVAARFNRSAMRSK